MTLVLPPLLSTPALAAALRLAGRQPLPQPIRLEPRLLAPMYRVAEGDIEHEGAAAAHLATEVAERLRRLAGAYAEWDQFEPAPYFDLHADYASVLVGVVERVSTVHVAFYVDALLPSFQAAVGYLQAEFGPAAGRKGAEAAVQAQMIAHWQRLTSVIENARTRLVHDLGFLTANNAGEERARWQAAWQQAPTAGLAADLVPRLAATPTLTLSTDFPLPAYRQPGRLRRLRRAQQRRLRSRQGPNRTHV